MAEGPGIERFGGSDVAWTHEPFSEIYSDPFQFFQQAGFSEFNGLPAVGRRPVIEMTVQLGQNNYVQAAKPPFPNRQFCRILYYID